MTPPKRQLGIMIAASIVIANMIGSGVFTTAGYQAAYSFKDPLTMISTWIVGGVIALCGAAVYAELGSLMPRAGGEYVYLREAYHPGVGFLSGWVSLIVGFSAPIAGAALLFSTHLGRLWEPLADPVVHKLIAVGLILAMTALHAFDTKVGGRVQAYFTAIKALLIVGFIIAGLTLGTGSWSHFAGKDDGLHQITTTAGAASYATALMYVSFAYSGWNAAAYIAGEIDRPQRTLPRALLLGTVLVMALYILLNLVFIYAVSPVEMGAVDPDKIPVGDLSARALFGAQAGSVVSSLIAVALMSTVSAMMMAGPRVYATMAADHALPHQLAYYSKRGVPSVAVGVQAVLAIAFALFSDPDEIFKFVGFTLSIFASLTVGAVFILRRRGQVSPFRTPGFPLTPLVFLLLSVWTVYFGIQTNVKIGIAVVGVLVAGFGVYFLTSHRPRVPIEADE